MDNNLDNCTLSYPPEEEFNVGTEIEVETTEDLSLPDCLSKLAAEKESVGRIDSLPTYTEEQIQTTETKTRGQAEILNGQNFAQR